jgi:hypothetical protein
MKLRFKLRHYQADIILFALRGYASTALTYRQLANKSSQGWRILFKTNPQLHRRYFLQVG